MKVTVLEPMLVRTINLLIAIETSHRKRLDILNTLDAVKVQKVAVYNICYYEVSGYG